MISKDIYPTWCTEYKVTFDEVMAESVDYWRNQLVNRGLLILKGLPPTLTDVQFHEITKKFGTPWTAEDYLSGSGNQDATLHNRNVAPTSYFKTNNNYWKGGEMLYHSDMAHVGEKSFPARTLYMIHTANNNSGKTEWLNLELAWEQFTQAEKDIYANVDIYQHFMYFPGTQIEKFPFLKKNPFTGKMSPRVNVYGQGRSWIHHVVKDGEELIEYKKLQQFMEGVYRLCESKKDTLYKHTWDDGDMLIYDNWFSVHRRDAISLEENEQDRVLKRLSFNIYP